MATKDGPAAVRRAGRRGGDRAGGQADDQASGLAGQRSSDPALADQRAGDVAQQQARDLAGQRAHDLTEQQARDLAGQRADDPGERRTSDPADDLTGRRTSGLAEEQAAGAAEEPGGGKCRGGGRAAWWRRGPADFDQEVEHLKAPDGGALLPWMLMVLGPAADVLGGKVALPWLAGSAIVAFCVLYAATIRTAFSPRFKTRPHPYVLLWTLAAVTLAVAIGYGGNFLLLFVLTSLCVGCVSRSRRHLGLALTGLSGAAGVVSGLHHQGFWSTVSLAYGSFLSGFVVSVIIMLFQAVAQLKATRQELARTAVAEERLRFSRDLHDLLGHTLSVVVVKAEAARRLARRDVDAALTQVADIEAVGRQALTEIREAVTGYREGSLATELDRARSALAASGIEAVLQESGPPLPPQTEALLGWVVREGVTNVVRHSGATLARIELRAAGGRARLTITDDGRGPAPAKLPASPTATLPRTGTGLRGLTERLAAAGGSLTTGPTPTGGFHVTATLPLDDDPPL